MQPVVTRNIGLLAKFNFLLDFRLYAPIMVIYFAQITGSYALAMSVLSVTMLSSALLELPTGIISDMIGRRWTLIVGALASLSAVICYAIGGHYWVLLIGATFEGLERALFSGNNDALLHDTLAEGDQRETYQAHLGRVSSAFQIALAVSAVVGGMISAVSFALVMWLSVIPKVIMVVLSFRFVEPRIHTETSDNFVVHLREAMRHFADNPRLRMLALAQMLAQGLGEATFQFRTVFIEMLWPLWAIGIARAVSNVGAAFSFYFAGNLLRRFGERKLLFGGITISELMNVVALVWASAVSPILMGATSLFFGVNTVAKNGLLQREFTDSQRSTMGSLTALGGSLMFALFAWVLGWLADEIGVVNALLVGTVVGTSRLLFFWLAFRRPSREPVGEQSLLGD